MESQKRSEYEIQGTTTWNIEKKAMNSHLGRNPHKCAIEEAKEEETLKFREENPLAVQWLGLLMLTAEGLGSILGGGTMVP